MISVGFAPPIGALVELKNSLIAEGRYTDPVDELLGKFVD